MTNTVTAIAAAVALCGITATPASAATPADKCQSGKLKESAKYASCRLKVESKAVLLGLPSDFSKCEVTFTPKFLSLDTKFGTGVCPTEGDEASINVRIMSDANDIAILLAGGSVPDCGNGITEANEQCDGSDLAGETCTTLGYTAGGTLACTAGCSYDTTACTSQRFPASGQTISYGTGDDGDMSPGAALQYVDNDDGTITDVNTGLTWEKKISLNNSLMDCANETGSCANPHDADNRYSWGAAFAPPYNGTVVTIFFEQLNDRCNNDTTVSCSVDADCAVPGGPCGFAGHRDWRLPSIKELHSILDYSVTFPGPTVDAAFHGGSCGPACTDITNAACSCTTSERYWSSTTGAGNGNAAWNIYFSDSVVGGDAKSNSYYVRAVRGGS